MLLRLCFVLCGFCFLRPLFTFAPAPLVSALLFPHAAVPTAPSSLPTRVFPHAAAANSPSCLLCFLRAASSPALSSLPSSFPLAASPANS